MEGPSIVIAKEELKPFQRKIPVAKAAAINLQRHLKGKKFLRAQSWGKHLLLHFTGIKLRVHFLMFGSYRIDDPREGRVPKLELRFPGGTIYFYSCAIKEISADELKVYDRAIDLMSEEWDEKRAYQSLRAKPQAFICDLLMDQSLFSGLGNIMKNEILFRCKVHPEKKISQLTPAKLKQLVKESQKYAWQFYEWKKKNVLKRNWLIMRKKKCPVCGGAVIKKPTGVGQRLSHFCPHCQR